MSVIYGDFFFKRAETCSTKMGPLLTTVRVDSILVYNIEINRFIQGIHKRIVRYQLYSPLKPHHYFVYPLYIAHISQSIHKINLNNEFRGAMYKQF